MGDFTLGGPNGLSVISTKLRFDDDVDVSLLFLTAKSLVESNDRSSKL